MIAAYALSDEQLLAECVMTSSSSHGPGGQHRNKTESAVRLHHLPTGVSSQCEDHRERSRNRTEALQRLRLRLAILTRGTSDPAWLTPYRKGGRLILGKAAREYPLAVACALDALAACAGRLQEAATALQVTSTQLVKLITADKEVHQAANRQRRELGLGPIRA